MRMIRSIAILLLLAGTAHAHPGPSRTIDVHFSPDPDRIGLEVSWGLVQSEDGGATWHWMCEDAIGFGGAFFPDYAYDGTGRLYATTTSERGLAFTDDHCTWQSALPIFVSQVEVGPDGTAFATASTVDDMRLYAGTGATMTPRSLPSAVVQWWESLAVAPTLLPGDQTRLYLTGYTVDATPTKTRYLFRSDDGGATWTELSLAALALPDCTLPELRIVAISPSDPDLVFAKLTRANCTVVGDDIWRSDDAGVSWTRVFQSTDDVNAVVVRQSGDVVLAEHLLGFHVSTDGGLTFGAALPDPPEINCLRERDGLLYLCSKGADPWNLAIGTSTDLASWTSFLAYRDVDDAYPGCADGTAQSDICEPQWCTTVCTYGIDDPTCECPGVPTPDAGPPVIPDPPESCCSAVLVVPLFRRRRRSR